MLVLTRKKGQKLIIGNNIEIVILESEFNSVKIGVSAPKNISVYREEIYLEIKKANEMSKMTDLDSLNFFEKNVLKTNLAENKR